MLFTCINVQLYRFLDVHNNCIILFNILPKKISYKSDKIHPEIYFLKHFSKITVGLYSVIRLGMKLSSYYLYFRVTFH